MSAARVGVPLVIAGFVEATVAVWWWALAGMSSEVGGAHVFTSLGLITTGGFILLWATDQ